MSTSTYGGTMKLRQRRDEQTLAGLLEPYRARTVPKRAPQRRIGRALPWLLLIGKARDPK